MTDTTTDKNTFILQQCVVADPEAVREGEWREDGPVMGWTPRLGKYRVTDPETGRCLFATADRAMEAAKAFQAKCADKLLGMDKPLPPGWTWVHRDIGMPVTHITSSACWCNPVATGPEDEVEEGGDERQ